MAEIRPLRALHYDQAVAGQLQSLVAPPYDVIDAEQRAALAARSPYNVVAIDLPQGGRDPYAHAAELLARWREQGALVRDPQPALWALTQDYAAPDGSRHLRRGIFARVRIEDYGPGRIRPHERTHPGPKEDRLRLTRATRANLSPIFSLHSDPHGAAWDALAPTVEREQPFGEVRDADGTIHRLWRVAGEDAIAAAAEAIAGAELLIADGHHRYETARAYARELGGEGDHRYVLMCLVALEDPGLLVFPTHRLLSGLGDAGRGALAAALERDFERADGRRDGHRRDPGAVPGFSYLDREHSEPVRLALRDPALAEAALSDHAPAYRRLDTAVLEALVLKGALGMSEQDIAELRGLGYAESLAEARELVRSGAFDAAFILDAAPVEQVRAVAAAGESMPPKSTYFFPKIPTGLLFNPLT